MAVVPAADAVELFGPGVCDKTLPANEVTEEYTFGQFIRLRYRPDVDEPQRAIVMAPPEKDLESVRPAFAAGPLVQAVTMLSLIAGKPEVPPAATADGGVTPIRVNSVNALLARGTVEVGGHDRELALEPGQVQDLLDGVAVQTVVAGHQGRVLLQPDDAAAQSEPAARRNVIGDLAAFLSWPVVPGVGGTVVPVELTSAGIRQLRSDGVATFGSGDKVVTIVVGETARVWPPRPTRLVRQRRAPWPRRRPSRAWSRRGSSSHSRGTRTRSAYTSRGDRRGA